MITASRCLGYDATRLAHLYLGSFSHDSLKIPSSSAQIFSGLSRDVRSGSSPGSGWATQGHTETCPDATYALSWLCAKIVVLLEGEPSPQAEVLRAGFHQGTLFIFPSILTSLPVPAAEKHPHSRMLPPPCFIVGMVPGFLQMWCLAFRPKS